VTAHYGSRAEALSLWQALESEHERYHAVIDVLPNTLTRVQVDLRRFLALRCAGFLEQLCFVVLTEYLKQKSSGGGPVHRFATSWFNRTPNLTPDNFVTLIAKFGPDHKKAIEEFLGPVRREILGDLLGIRNDVAHGKTSLKGAKLDPARYMVLCEDVYDWMTEHFLGESVEVLSDDGTTVMAHEGVQS